nr:MAG TPA: hypothetical protein [Caudoviricetes sp.]
MEENNDYKDLYLDVMKHHRKMSDEILGKNIITMDVMLIVVIDLLVKILHMNINLK